MVQSWLSEMQARLASPEAPAQIEALDKEIVRLKRAIDRLLDMIETGDNSREVRERQTLGEDEATTTRTIMADLEFHLVIARGCGNGHLAKAISDSRMMTHLMGRRYLPSTMPFPDKLAATAAEHQAILDALRRHDGAAARDLMGRHIRLAQQSMDRWYDGEEQRAGGTIPLYPPSIQTLIGRMTR